MSLRDEVINAIRHVLPCDSIAEITAKVNKRMHEDFTPEQINKAIAHLRREEAENRRYSWTIPHVDPRQGKNRNSKRYFAQISRTRGGEPMTDEKRLAYTEGAHTSLQRIATQLKNEATALLSCSTVERSPHKKAQLEQFVKDMGYLSEKAEFISQQFGT